MYKICFTIFILYWVILKKLILFISKSGQKHVNLLRILTVPLLKCINLDDRNLGNSDEFSTWLDWRATFFHYYCYWLCSDSVLMPSPFAPNPPLNVDPISIIENLRREKIFSPECSQKLVKFTKWTSQYADSFGKRWAISIFPLKNDPRGWSFFWAFSRWLKSNFPLVSPVLPSEYEYPTWQNRRY